MRWSRPSPTIEHINLTCSNRCRSADGRAAWHATHSKRDRACTKRFSHMIAHVHLCPTAIGTPETPTTTTTASSNMHQQQCHRNLFTCNRLVLHIIRVCSVVACKRVHLCDVGISVRPLFFSSHAQVGRPVNQILTLFLCVFFLFAPCRPCPERRRRIQSARIGRVAYGVGNWCTTTSAGASAYARAHALAIIAQMVARGDPCVLTARPVCRCSAAISVRQHLVGSDGRRGW